MNENNIIWKDVPIEEFKNSYEVSNTGQIRNKKTLKIKTTQLGSTGYVTTRLDIGSVKKTVQLHSMVAEAFLKPIEIKENKKIIVKFKDENKNNLHVNNLCFEYQNSNKVIKINNDIKNNIKINNDIKNNVNNKINNIIDNLEDINIDDTIIINNINNININDKVINDEEMTINDFKGKIISNYPDYLISKDGQVYSIKSKKIRKIEINDNGYCRIRLSNNTTKKDAKFYVHRLVAEAYIPNPNNYDQVNHKDLDKHNNNVENLEWCNGAMNMKHNANNKPENSKKVIQFDPLDTNKIIGTFDSIKEASIKVKIDNTSIIHCCSGKYKTAGGYKWKYAN